jgi:hypothetical protein
MAHDRIALQNVLDSNVAKRSSHGECAQKLPLGLTCYIEVEGVGSDSQNDKLAWLDYEDARGHQRKSNDEHDEGSEYEAAKEEQTVPSAY